MTKENTGKKYGVKKVLFLILFIALLITFYNLWSITSNKQPVLVFNEDVSFEYAETIEEDDLIREAINQERSYYHRIVQFDTPDTSSITTTSKRTIEIVAANNNGLAREFYLEYSVVDTKSSGKEVKE